MMHRTACVKLAIIAGNGRFPFLVLDAARSLGHDVTIIGIKEEASKDLEAAAAGPPKADLHWVSIGHLGTFLKILKDAGITTAVMAGQVKHIKIFGFVPDLTAMALMTRLASRNTDSLIAAVADLMREHGVELINSATVSRADAGPPGTAERTRADRRRAQGSRVRLSHGRRDCRTRHRPDDRGQAPGRRRRRGDGRHRRDHRARRSPRRRRRHHRQGGEAEAGHAVRRADRGAGDDPGDAHRRRHGAVDRCRQDADLRSRGVLRVGQRGGDRSRGPGHRLVHRRAAEARCAKVEGTES